MRSFQSTNFCWHSNLARAAARYHVAFPETGPAFSEPRAAIIGTVQNFIISRRAERRSPQNILGTDLYRIKGGLQGTLEESVSTAIPSQQCQ